MTIRNVPPCTAAPLHTRTLEPLPPQAPSHPVHRSSSPPSSTRLGYTRSRESRAALGRCHRPPRRPLRDAGGGRDLCRAVCAGPSGDDGGALGSPCIAGGAAGGGPGVVRRRRLPRSTSPGGAGDSGAPRVPVCRDPRVHAVVRSRPARSRAAARHRPRFGRADVVPARPRLPRPCRPGRCHTARPRSRQTRPPHLIPCPGGSSRV